MLTRPPPAPLTMGRAPHRAQVHPFGGISPCPALSSKRMKTPRSRSLYLRPHRGLPHRDRGRSPRRHFRMRQPESGHVAGRPASTNPHWGEARPGSRPVPQAVTAPSGCSLSKPFRARRPTRTIRKARSAEPDNLGAAIALGKAKTPAARIKRYARSADCCLRNSNPSQCSLEFMFSNSRQGLPSWAR